MYDFGEVISSRQNRSVVELCKLSDRKHREEKRQFRFDGIKLLEEAIQKELEIVSVFLRNDSAKSICQMLEDRHGETVFSSLGDIKVLSREIFDKISEEKSPEGVITIAKYIDKFEKFATIYNSAEFSIGSDATAVLLESVRDPSNLGAIIRSAAALGVSDLIISEDCADIYHPKTVRASMGMLFVQRIHRVPSLKDAIVTLQKNGRRVFAAALDEKAKRLGDFSLKDGDCVVIGNEGHGISKEIIDACNSSVMIPMCPHTESLNAAAAAAILMWEFTKAARIK